MPALAASRYRFSLRRGQLSMVAGAPGSGKTIVAQWQAVHGRVPTVFFSADTDETLMANRTAAMLTGYEHTRVDGAEGAELAYLTDELHAGSSHILWDFTVDHTMRTISNTVEAAAMMFGEWPHLVVFDVLLSFQQGGGEWGAMNEFLLHCKTLAQETNAHVMVLHHTVGSWTDKTQAPPRSALVNKVDQFPALIVTLGADHEMGTLQAAVVKNRNGPGDPRAEAPILMGVDFGSCQIRELPAPGSVAYS
jgi:replicative DNA helicase